MKLKQTILSIILILSVFFITPILSAKEYTGTFTFCTRFTHTPDIEILDIWEDIMGVIQFTDGKPSTHIAWIQAEEISDSGTLQYTGQDPAGNPISIQSRPREVSSSKASYALAETSNADNALLYLDYDSLSENISINDVFLEAFLLGHTNIENPVFDFTSEDFRRLIPLDSICEYVSDTHTLTYINGAGQTVEFGARVYIISDDPIEGFASFPANPSEEDATTPTNPSEETSTESSTLDFKILLGIGGGLLGLVLILAIINFCKMVILWIRK